MEWTESLKFVISYIEKHILEEININKISNEVHISPFYLQKGFSIITGYTIGEYIRYRRLYLAAFEVISGNEKIIDIAYKYGYDTPESFTKAFRRFHGVSPAQMKKCPVKIKTFLPLKISISISGGNEMDYIVERMKGFKVIGFEREISFDSGYSEIPKFWNEFCEKYMKPLQNSENPQTPEEQTIADCRIGEYGVCIDDIGKDGKFRYLIAGTYRGGDVPDGMTVYELPDMEWAKFKCIGPMPEALQSVNTAVFRDWLPNNPNYKIAMGVNIEYYFMGDTSSPDYESAIWVPVERKH